jgi:hypothetical protein
MTRRDLFRFIGARIAAFTVFSAGYRNVPAADVSTAAVTSGILADALLAEDGGPLLTENGEYLLMG